MINNTRADLYFEPGIIPLRVVRITHQADLAAHRHEFSELVIITGGRGLHRDKTLEYPIVAGDVFFVRRSAWHAYADTEALSLINLLFDESALRIPGHDIGSLPGHHALFTLEPHYRERHKFGSRLRLPVEALAQADAMVEQIERELAERRPGFQYLATAGFMTLVGFLCRCYSATRTPSVRPLLRLGAVISHLEQHLHEPITMADLVRRAAMSERSLRRAFRETTGYAPIDYLIRLRVARGALLLRTTDARISEIAWQSGFEDSNYFTRQFRAIMGCGPREYRKRNAANR